jgi:hypothetical protein
MCYHSDDAEAPYRCVCTRCFTLLHRRHGLELTKHLRYPPKEPWHHHLRPCSDEAHIALGNKRRCWTEEEYNETFGRIDMPTPEDAAKQKHYFTVKGVWEGGSLAWPFYCK